MRKFTTCLVIVLAVTLAFTTRMHPSPVTSPRLVKAPNTPQKCGWRTLKRPADWTSVERKYKVEVVIEDNESKAESAVKANTKMITEDEVIMPSWAPSLQAGRPGR
jgi:hypothetical protein